MNKFKDLSNLKFNYWLVLNEYKIRFVNIRIF
jgi:hypothetical protein